MCVAEFPVNTLCVCMFVLCKPHYLYHFIKFLSLSLSEIIEHLEEHQSATHTHTADMLHLNTYMHTLMSINNHNKAQDL